MAKPIHLVGLYIDFQISNVPIVLSDFIIEEVGKKEINGHREKSH